jgi:hypothetical protein
LTKYITNLNEKNTRLIAYEWFKDDSPIVYKANTNLYKDGSLEITQVNLDDSGTYSCIAKYRSLVYKSNKAHVSVNPHITNNLLSTSKAPPKFLIWPEDRSQAEHDEVIFECLALNDASLFSGGHIEAGSNLSLANQRLQFYRYKWLKDGVALEFDSTTTTRIKSDHERIKLVQGVNLRLERLRESDAGTYTCRICNSNQKSLPMDKDFFYDNAKNANLYQNEHREQCDERSASLRVLVAPRFIKRPSNLNVTLKSDAELECSAYGRPHPTIQWFKNGEPIYPSDYFQFNAQEGNLKILGIIAQDEGYYQCLASNELNSIQSVAQLTTIAESLSSLESTDYELDTEDYSQKIITTTATTIRNLYDIDLLAQSSPVIVHLSAPLSLRILKSKPRSLKLEWKRPAIVRNIPIDQSHPTGDDASGLLYYAINWKPTNMDRKREINTTFNSIVIDELTPDTVYLINVCAMLSTKKGPYSFLEAKTEKDTQIPGAPVQFKYEIIEDSQSGSQIKFKWKRPLVNWSKIAKYRLYYQHLNYGPYQKPVQQQDSSAESGIGDNFENYQFMDEEYDSFLEPENDSRVKEPKKAEKYLDINSAESEECSFPLDDLHKYSAYKFRLAALENDDDLDPDNTNAAELIIETISDVPDGPPENLQIETLNTTSILCQWSMPLIEARNGFIVGYKIAVKENDKEVWDSNVDSEPRRKIISGLLPGHKYSVRITARTVNGSGPMSEWFIAETFLREMDESRVPGQPEALFTEPTDKSIVIHWQPPIDASNTILIRKYLLRYGTSPTNEVYMELPANRLGNSYIINNLVPSTQYILSLKAGNNAGFGKELLKDVITKRKYALGENENLFPPLNVHATSLSPDSIQIDWTDWHLKPSEPIPDDRHYLVRYAITEKTTQSKANKYQYRNSSARTLSVTGLKDNTLYDFAVRLVIGRRESDWSMTTSQMTQELSPAPRNISIESDVTNPANLILSWLAPTVSLNADLNSGYVISYSDEYTFKENQSPNAINKWKYEHVNSNAKTQLQHHTIRRLKPETIYYFKIQARNNRAYGASSPTIKFKTPNSKGEGGGRIFLPTESNVGAANVGAEIYATATSHLKDKEKWILGGIVLAFLALFIIIFSVIKSSKTKKNTKSSSSNHGHQKSTKRSNSTLNQPNEQNLQINDCDMDEVESIYQKHNHLQQQQQQVLISQQGTLLKHHQQYSTKHSNNTPSHQALMISNPNHMMLNLMTNNPNNTNCNSSQNHTNLTDCEFYSNVPQAQPSQFTNNSHSISESGYHNSTNIDSFQFNQPNQQYDEFSNEAALAAASAAFNSPFLNNNNNNNNNNNSNQIMLNQNNNNNNEPSFLRNTIRPKPIAIPFINTTASGPTMSNQMNEMNHNQHQSSTGMFPMSNASHRKSFKNLPIATATLISSNNNNNTNNNSSNYFNDIGLKQQTQKLHYTARPYIIDNQVQQSNGDYSNTSNHSNHSPASSCHSSNQAQMGVYDKIGNIVNQSTKSLLQPLKSFSTNQQQQQQHQHQAHATVSNATPTHNIMSSMSIPNTPAKYCPSGENNFMNMTRSPGKKQLLVSLASQNSCTTASVMRGSNYVSANKSSDMLMMMGKSIENVNYDKKSNGLGNEEELTAEMANLEGIMKDLSAITATQFEC